jgi:hypothetical protein
MQVQNEEKFKDGETGTAFVHGEATGTYIFNEDKSQKGTGTFKGKFSIGWANGINGIVFAHYEMGSAVEFIGDWTSYATGKSKKADWCIGGYCSLIYYDDGQNAHIDDKYLSKGLGERIIEIWWKQK